MKNKPFSPYENMFWLRKTFELLITSGWGTNYAIPVLENVLSWGKRWVFFVGIDLDLIKMNGIRNTDYVLYRWPAVGASGIKLENGVWLGRGHQQSVLVCTGQLLTQCLYIKNACARHTLSNAHSSLTKMYSLEGDFFLFTKNSLEKYATCVNKYGWKLLSGHRLFSCCILFTGCTGLSVGRCRCVYRYTGCSSLVHVHVADHLHIRHPYGSFFRSNQYSSPAPASASTESRPTSS